MTWQWWQHEREKKIKAPERRRGGGRRRNGGGFILLPRPRLPCSRRHLGAACFVVAVLIQMAVNLFTVWLTTTTTTARSSSLGRRLLPEQPVEKGGGEEDRRRFSSGPADVLLWNDDEAANNDTTKALPTWYRDYARWHLDTLRQLQQETTTKSDPDAWRRHRYLLVRCVAKDLICGGAADRLFHLPAILYLAYRAKRLLFIYWTKPAPLEAFLVPPLRSVLDHEKEEEDDQYPVIDWRLPAWLVPLLQADTPRLPWSFVRQELEHVNERNRFWDDRSERLISIKRLHHGVVEYYDFVVHTPQQQPPQQSSSFRDSCHAIWTHTFQPSPAVYKQIQTTMATLGLTADFVHWTAHSIIVPSQCHVTT
jgi:hypothetical protein